MRIPKLRGDGRGGLVFNSLKVFCILTFEFGQSLGSFSLLLLLHQEQCGTVLLQHRLNYLDQLVINGIAVISNKKLNVK